MTYDIYFHNDFDGVASAAVVLNFLESRGDTVGSFCPVDHTMGEEWKRENFFKKNSYFPSAKNPVVVVDFPYHPAAAMWFDHHPSAFKKPEWEKNFKPDERHVFAQNYFSCCRLVMDSFAKNFGYKPARYIGELSKWLDIIDAARHKSARQAVLMREAALRVNACIDREAHSATALRRYVRLVADLPLSKIMEKPRVASLWEKIQTDTKKSYAYYKKETKMMGNVAIVDETPIARIISRFTPLAINPGVEYLIRYRNEAKKGAPRSGRTWRLVAGVNPWNMPKKFPAIGKLLSRLGKGGGGHDKVGGITGMTQKEVERVVGELVRVFTAS